jgi:putative aminopeptidase FrvX
MNLMDKLESHLKNLSLLPGLSGHEQKVSDYMKASLDDLGLSVTVDTLGNTFATIEGTDAGAPAVLVTAHMDQLGFVVKTIDPYGFIRLERGGGIPEKTLPSLRVTIVTKTGNKSRRHRGEIPHLTPAEMKNIRSSRLGALCRY